MDKLSIICFFRRIVNQKVTILVGHGQAIDNLFCFRRIMNQKVTILVGNGQAIDNLFCFRRIVNQKVTILVGNGQGKKLPKSISNVFRNIKIHNEFDSTLLRTFKATVWDVIVFDGCGRETFHYFYPKSWLGFPFIS